jgi:hypothetical protein
MHQGQEESGDGMVVDEINPTADMSFIATAVTADIAASAKENKRTAEFRECDKSLHENKVDDCIDNLCDDRCTVGRDGKEWS